MAMQRSVPRRPTAAEVTAMTAGPKRKRMAMVMAATEFPQAMIFGCMAMKSPVSKRIVAGIARAELDQTQKEKKNFIFEMILEVNRPKLNMAIPSPASESMEMEFFTMIGIAMWNLQKPFQLIHNNAIGIMENSV